VVCDYQLLSLQHSGLPGHCNPLSIVLHQVRFQDLAHASFVMIKMKKVYLAGLPTHIRPFARSKVMTY
jgi:hypothetical protein